MHPRDLQERAQRATAGCTIGNQPGAILARWRYTVYRLSSSFIDKYCTATVAIGGHGQRPSACQIIACKLAKSHLHMTNNACKLMKCSRSASSITMARRPSQAAVPVTTPRACPRRRAPAAAS